MIAVKLEGRLGNQLFQYAFIYAAAKKLNTQFYLDTRVDYLLIDQYFNIENNLTQIFDQRVFSIKGYKNIFSHHSRYKFYRLLTHFLGLKPVHIDNTADPVMVMNSLADKTLYTGFFQSELYFMPCKNDISQLFSIKDKYKKQFETIVKNSSIPQKYVAIHIRRGDYVNGDMALNYKYFHQAIKSIHQEDNFYVFISDEPDVIAPEFNNITSKYISHNTEIVDFQFITNADVCIISNSSFSWWAAYLNNKKTKVIAPEYWFGAAEKIEYPRGIMPANFIAFNAFYN
jgi:hypothetical protein